MAAAVVPEQVGLGHIQGKAIVQNAFEVLNIQIFLIHGVGGEEGGGGHLLGVAHDHRIAATGQNAHGLTGGQLGGLVEDDDVEGLPLGVQILGGGNGAHEHAGAEAGQEIGDLVEEAADAGAPAAALDAPLEDTQLGTLGGFPGEVGDLRRQTAVDLLLGQGGPFPVGPLVLLDLLVKDRAGEGIEGGADVDGVGDQGKEQGLLVGGVDHVVLGVAAIAGRDVGKTCGLCLLLNGDEGDPLLQLVLIVPDATAEGRLAVQPILCFSFR